MSVDLYDAFGNLGPAEDIQAICLATHVELERLVFAGTASRRNGRRLLPPHCFHALGGCPIIADNLNLDFAVAEVCLRDAAGNPLIAIWRGTTGQQGKSWE